MDTSQHDVKVSIIRSAGKIFAEKGFRAATVRQICTRADVNVAAINYYFGNKKKLYASVLSHYKDEAYDKYPLNYGINPHDSPALKINSFIRTMMLRIFEEGNTPWFGKLLLRELIEPTGGLDILIKNVFRPSFSILAKLVEEAMGQNATPRSVYLCTMSIFGQCLYFSNSPSITRQMLKRKKISLQEIDALARHISRFSLAALEYYTQAKEADIK